MSLILIIEDSPLMAGAAEAALTAAGFEAFSCLSIGEGLAAVQERRPDLALTEYFVAEATGLDFLERLASLDDPPPVVMATGQGGEEAAARALALGAWSYILKTERYLPELPGLVGNFLEKINALKKDRERERARGRLAAQNEMAGWLAHNFKNILAASIGYLNLVNFRNPDQTADKREEYLLESRRSQETALQLLERLISMTEAEGGAETERLIVADLAEEAWATAMKATLEASGLQYPERLDSLKVELERAILMNGARRLPPVEFVREDLCSILLALLRNSLEATRGEEDPRVLISGEIQGRRLELTVRDNGRGMNAEVLKRAREPLFSTKGEVGVGLGLSLADALVGRHGGTLDIKSSPGAGATVKLSLSLGG